MTISTKSAPAPVQRHDFAAMADEEHKCAELLRLEAGQDSCGCSMCQELYATIDLSRYGRRVKHQGDVVYITGSISHDGVAGTADLDRMPRQTTPHKQPCCAIKVDDVLVVQRPGRIMAQPVTPAPVPEIKRQRRTKAITRTATHRGRPQRPGIPVKRIHDLSAAGQPSRSIATTLEAEGISISFRTVARILAGERPLL